MAFRGVETAGPWDENLLWSLTSPSRLRLRRSIQEISLAVGAGLSELFVQSLCSFPDLGCFCGCRFHFFFFQRIAFSPGRSQSPLDPLTLCFFFGLTKSLLFSYRLCACQSILCEPVVLCFFLLCANSSFIIFLSDIRFWPDLSAFVFFFLCDIPGLDGLARVCAPFPFEVPPTYMFQNFLSGGPLFLKTGFLSKVE